MSLTKQDLTDIRDVVLDALDVAVNPRLDSLEAHVDRLDLRMDSLETKVDRLEGRMDGLEGKMDGLESRMDNLEGKMSAQELAQRETNRHLGSIEKTIENIDGRLMAIEADVKQLYRMSGTEKTVAFGKKFSALPPEQKLRTLHGELLNLAKQLHVEL